MPNKLPQEKQAKTLKRLILKGAKPFKYSERTLNTNDREVEKTLNFSTIKWAVEKP